jgi:hypothetical protein
LIIRSAEKDENQDIFNQKEGKITKKQAKSIKIKQFSVFSSVRSANSARFFKKRLAFALYLSIAARHSKKDRHRVTGAQ